MIYISRSEWIIESGMKEEGLGYNEICNMLDRAINEQLMYQTTMKVSYSSKVLFFAMLG
jgi:hypothetical protein